MSNPWERFNGIANKDEVALAKSAFQNPEAGIYEATLVVIAMAESKDQLPKLTAQFKTLEGGKTLFYNQMLQNLSYPQMTAKNIADAVNFVSGIVGYDYDFEKISSLADFVSTIVCGDVYKIEISYAKKDEAKKYPIFKVIEKVPDENDLPFGLDGTN